MLLSGNISFIGGWGTNFGGSFFFVLGDGDFRAVFGDFRCCFGDRLFTDSGFFPELYGK